MSKCKDKSISTPYGEKFLRVCNYDSNSRIAIMLYDKDECYYDDLTINLPNFFISDIDEGYINGDINFTDEKGYNIVNTLKKLKIIKESYGFRSYNLGKYEYVKFDLEKLKEYDSKGIQNFHNQISEVGEFQLYDIKIQIGGVFIRKKIKFNGKLYNISVYKYYNGKIRLKYESKTESHDITLSLDDIYLIDNKVLLDPFIEKNGLIKVLIKNRIIRDVTSINYDYIEIPTAKINMGILKQYDRKGISKYLNNKEELLQVID